MRRICLYITLFIFSTCLWAQDSLTHKKSKIFFNLQSALLFNNSFSNIDGYYSSNQQKIYYQEGERDHNKPICFGYFGGAEILIGKKRHFKHVLNVSIELTNSVILNRYNHTNSGADYTIKRRVFFANIGYGVYVKLYKNINLTSLFNITPYANLKDVKNGYSSYDYTIKFTGIHVYDTTFYKNEKYKSDGLLDLISLRLKLSYDFLIKERAFSCFVMHNIGSVEIMELIYWNHKNLSIYKAPWWMIGLQFCPFGKSKPTSK